MNRADNPILLWLVAHANERHARAVCGEGPLTGPYWVGVWVGRIILLTEVLDVCRWLDAEDELLQRMYRALPLDEHKAAFRRWDDWRYARMAEAGVL